ncbi:TPA: hypothetical protein ACPSKY_001101 [Legionella bozemanae]|uniref:hypothetical protein n=1 Tax=Legionella bozemanae TaxID=447 RepID=UPI0013EFBF8A|nr:hypothetical protein [Legionella bozemanae]
MTARILFRKITLIFYLCTAMLLLGSCTKAANSNAQHAGIGEEYGKSDPAWR